MSYKSGLRHTTHSLDDTFYIFRDYVSGPEQSLFRLNFLIIIYSEICTHKVEISTICVTDRSSYQSPYVET